MFFITIFQKNFKAIVTRAARLENSNRINIEKSIINDFSYKEVARNHLGVLTDFFNFTTIKNVKIKNTRDVTDTIRTILVMSTYLNLS